MGRLFGLSRFVRNLGAENLFDILRQDYLPVHQQLRQTQETLLVFQQQGAGLLVDEINQFLDLFINEFRRLVAVGRRQFIAACARTVIIGKRTDGFAHSVVFDHRISHRRQTFQIVQSTGRRLPIDDFFRHTTANQGTHLIHHLVARHQRTLLRQVPSRTQGLSARDDGHFEQRMGIGQKPTDRRVPRFVMSDGEFLLIGNNLFLALQSADNPVHRLGKGRFVHRLLVVAGRIERRLIAHIGNIRSGEAGRMLGDKIQVEIRSQFNFAQMHLKDFLTLIQVRQINVNLTVKTTGPHQSLVQNIGPVGRSQDNHPAVGVKTIHLRQQLIERILPLIVGRETGILAPGTSHRIDFIDKHDAGSFFLGLAEQIPHTGSTDSNEHFDEIRARNREERHIGLPCHGFCQQGLTCSRRAYQQGALGNFAAQRGIFLGIFKEINNFHHLFLGTIQSGDILEGNFHLVLVRQLPGRFAGRKDTAALAAAAHHTPEHKDPHQNQHQREKQPIHRPLPEFVIILNDHLETVFLRKALVQLTEHLLGIERRRHHKGEMRGFRRDFPAEFVRIGSQFIRADGNRTRKVIADIHNLLDIPGLRHRFHLLPFDFLGVGISGRFENHPQDDQDENEIQPGKIERNDFFLLIILFRRHSLVFICKFAI